MKITLIPLYQHVLGYTLEVRDILERNLIFNHTIKVSHDDEGSAGTRIKLALENADHVIIIGRIEHERKIIFNYNPPYSNPTKIEDFVALLNSKQNGLNQPAEK